MLIESVENVPMGLRLTLVNLKYIAENWFSADNIRWEALLGLGVVSLYVKNNGTDWIFGVGTRLLFINLLARYCVINGDYLVNAMFMFPR